LGAFIAGCGGPNAAKVSGQVTLDDQPLTSGTVTFHPQSGNGAVAYGQIDAQGRYELSTGSDAGLAPGPYVATVLATEEIPATRANEESTFKPTTPARYNNIETSGLKFEVKAGRNDLPLALTSR
jgi:hypothetical protein